MSGLRAGLEEMAADTPVYGDLDRAIRQAGEERRHRAGLMLGATAAAAVLALIAGMLAVNRLKADGPPPAGPPTVTDTAPVGVKPIEFGGLDPGRYRHFLPVECAGRLGACPTPLPPPVTFDITVPAHWQFPEGAGSLFPAAGRVDTDDPALTLGVASLEFGLYSRPCHTADEPKPDRPVLSPTVDDIVQAISDHPRLRVGAPRPVQLGRNRGQVLSLIGPQDISQCGEWRPWSPGIYAQGDKNLWDVWIIDVDGVPVVFVLQYYPDTPPDVLDELRAMAGSIRFVPGAS